MKDVYGGPGKLSGVFLRMGQCLFSAASLGLMAASHEFYRSTVFSFLILSMVAQFFWCFLIVCFDIHALRLNMDLQPLARALAIGDWATSVLSLGAASSSAGVMVAFSRDAKFCSIHNCSLYQMSIVFAFASWFLLAVSAHIMLWIYASP